MTHPVAQCAGKVGFASPALAHSVAARSRRRSTRVHDRAGLRVAYKCPYCGLWHLGRPVPKAKGA